MLAGEILTSRQGEYFNPGHKEYLDSFYNHWVILSLVMTNISICLLEDERVRATHRQSEEVCRYPF